MRSLLSTNERVEIGIRGKRDLVIFLKMWEIGVM